jgi:signal transduction histidine kinase/streptogramin lyase
LAGINKLNQTASTFTHYPQTPTQPSRGWGTQSVTVLDPHHPPELSDNAVSAVYQDRQGILWIGTNTTFRGELNRVDRSTGIVTVFQHDPENLASLNGGPIYVIYEDQGGTLWIGSLNGLNRFNPGTQSFQSEAIFQHRVTSVVEDQQGALWVGYWGGLYRRAPGASTFSSVPLDRELTSNDRIYAIYPDRTGAVWIRFGNIILYRLDPATEDGSEFTLIHFPQDRSDPKSPGIGTVMSFFEDLQGTLWMGSVEDGLVRFNRDTQTFTHYLPDTRPGRYVGCIQGDDQGFLWMGTELGLARFDPRLETFSYFDSRDGLEIGENAEASACFQNQQGEMFFGSSKGLNSFFPTQIQDNPNLPPVVITALNLRNQPLRTNLAPNEKIRFSYLQNYLSFDFVSLDYTAPAKNQYVYKMDGLDTGWVDAGARRHADYPDLKPGTYTFRVKASNNRGVWNEQGATVEITITPPFWQTWWFIGLAGVLLAGMVVGGVRMRLKDVQAYSRKLESQVASRTDELEASVAQFAALQETSKAVVSTLELNSLLNLIIQQAITLLHADGGFVNIVDWENGVDEVVAIAGIAPPMIGERTPLDGGLSGWATLHNQATISNQIPENDRVAKRARTWVKEAHIQSAAVTPLIVKGQVKGTLLVMGRKEGKEKFVQADLDLLVAFANQAAIAIENASLYEQPKKLAVLEERGRLARELHDAVTQTLFSASLVAEALPTAWEKDQQEGRELLKELRGLSRGALAEMRSLLLELRPSALVETRLGDLLRQLGEATSGRAGIPVCVQVEGQAELPPYVHITFYRIAQEALNNIVKHARARQADVRLIYFNQDIDSDSTWLKVELTIWDDGRGFDPAQIPHNRLGLGIMLERAQAIGARLTITSQPGRGTEITVQWEQADNEEAT